MTLWKRFPQEIRLSILEDLLEDDCSLAGFATVSREWQTTIERHNFSRIKLTPSRIAELGSYFIVIGALCEPDRELWGLSYADNLLISKAFEGLFSILSEWEQSNGLLLDISVYSPSDSDHWFKYLTFEPDVDSDLDSWDQHQEQRMLTQINDHHHGWTAGSRGFIPAFALDKVFEEVMGEGPFDDEEKEGQWWQQLPLVPVVTCVLLRQQSRRRWKPEALVHMFSRLPELQEFIMSLEGNGNYLSRSRRINISTPASLDLQHLLDSLSPNPLRRLVLLENFNQAYPDSYRRSMNTDYTQMRIPSPLVSRAMAKASLTLEQLSASFILDASHFFSAREISWKWPNLTWVALTSRLLVPQEVSTELDVMLQAAAAAAMEMPNLGTMEIWNGEKGVAILFRYQRPELGHPAVITCRGTWALTLEAAVTQAWDSVALRHGGQGHNIVKELLDTSVCINSHGDAIHHLKLSRPVVRPISLRQIQMEHRIRKVM